MFGSNERTRGTRRRALADGFFAVSPLLIGVVPFGLIFGATAAATDLGFPLSYATSVIIFGGAAQLMTVDLLGAGTAAIVVIATGLIVQARHTMYSAAIAPHFAEFSMKWRYLGAYLLTDQAFAISIVRYESATDPVYKRLFFFGAAATMWAIWQITTIVGYSAGTTVPDDWNLDFAVPLVFLALLIPTIRTKPMLVAALIGGVVAILGVEIPLQIGLITAALSGVASGVLTERWLERR